MSAATEPRQQAQELGAGDLARVTDHLADWLKAEPGTVPADQAANALAGSVPVLLVEIERLRNLQPSPVIDETDPPVWPVPDAPVLPVRYACRASLPVGATPGEEARVRARVGVTLDRLVAEYPGEVVDRRICWALSDDGMPVLIGHVDIVPAATG